MSGRFCGRALIGRMGNLLNTFEYYLSTPQYFIDPSGMQIFPPITGLGYPYFRAGTPIDEEERYDGWWQRSLWWRMYGLAYDGEFDTMLICVTCLGVGVGHEPNRANQDSLLRRYPRKPGIPGAIAGLGSFNIYSN